MGIPNRYADKGFTGFLGARLDGVREEIRLAGDSMERLVLQLSVEEKHHKCLGRLEKILMDELDRVEEGINERT